MTAVTIWILTLISGVMLQVLANDPIQYLVARLLGNWLPRRPRGVKGIWLSEYSYRSRGVFAIEKQLIELKQFGNYVAGRNITSQAHGNRIRGKVFSQTYFTGTWQSTR